MSGIVNDYKTLSDEFDNMRTRFNEDNIKLIQSVNENNELRQQLQQSATSQKSYNEIEQELNKIIGEITSNVSDINTILTNYKN